MVVEEPSTAIRHTTAAVDQIIEEAAEAVNKAANVNPTAELLATIEVAAKASGRCEESMVRKGAQKPADDRLFTWAHSRNRGSSPKEVHKVKWLWYGFVNES
ncbi:hypothetical protein F2Q70_00023269 [Brassica cretica]|uniref:Uncharacterized protein n=1 Tax=Brassica cretica TaxID=69181 RepID=A0A8S9GX00_BRACR|nr:hypothetical protein F2Q70_00023269 [Brassica cretica]